MSQQTQRKATLGTYRKLAALIPQDARVLDYGAGYCLGAQLLGADSLEPFPREGVVPTFTRAWQIVDGTYDVVVCNCVLNIIDNSFDRRQILADIMRVLRPEGVAYIMVRSWTDVEKAQGRIREGDGYRITSTGAFQRGYTFQELEALVSPLGTTERIREVSNIGIRLTIHE